MDRKWMPTFSELIDRLSIHQLKEVKIPENKSTYASEMADIVHDLNQIILEKNIDCTGELIQAIVVVSQINAHIWYNESKVRNGEDQDVGLLKLTHGLNGLRNNCMNLIKSMTGDENRKDFKTDCLAADFKDWEFSILK